MVRQAMELEYDCLEEGDLKEKWQGISPTTIMYSRDIIPFVRKYFVPSRRCK